MKINQSVYVKSHKNAYIKGTVIEKNRRGHCIVEYTQFGNIIQKEYPNNLLKHHTFLAKQQSK